MDQFMIASGITPMGERFSVAVRGYRVTASMVELDPVEFGPFTVARERSISVEYPGGGIDTIPAVALVAGKIALKAA